MTHPTEAELGIMDAFVEAGLTLSLADCRALLAESRRLREFLAMAWKIIGCAAQSQRAHIGDNRDYDRLWLACLELGIVHLTPMQVKRFQQMPFEPYKSAVRIYEARHSRG